MKEEFTVDIKEDTANDMQEEAIVEIKEDIENDIMKESFDEINKDTENDTECKTSSDIMESTYNDLREDLSGNMTVDESETDMSFVFTSTPVKESCKECLDKSG